MTEAVWLKACETQSSSTNSWTWRDFCRKTKVPSKSPNKLEHNWPVGEIVVRPLQTRPTFSGPAPPSRFSGRKWQISSHRFCASISMYLFQPSVSQGPAGSKQQGHHKVLASEEFPYHRCVCQYSETTTCPRANDPFNPSPTRSGEAQWQKWLVYLAHE